MFQFVGYNFVSDGDALEPAPGLVEQVSKIHLTNAIYDHMNVSTDITTPVSTTKPTDWTYGTLIDVDFNGSLEGGNVDFLTETIDEIRIKRRKVGDTQWTTLTTIRTDEQASSLVFSYNDMLAQNNTMYEYALVPVIEDVEGDYLINSILSQFNGVFIGDAETIYKFLYEVEYGSNQRNQQVGIFQVLGQQFPVFVANGELSYESGSVTATILNDDFEQTGVIDRTAITQQKDAIKDFLTNKKAKILKDWSGNEWLCIVNSNIAVTYKSGSGMGIPSITFEWTEIGKADNQQDLYNNGILDEVG